MRAHGYTIESACRWLRALFSYRWPAGVPFMAGDERIGTVLADGTIQFRPGIRAQRISAADQTVEPERDQRDSDDVQRRSERGEAARI